MCVCKRSLLEESGSPAAIFPVHPDKAKLLMTKMALPHHNVLLLSRSFPVTVFAARFLMQDMGVLAGRFRHGFARSHP